MSSVSLVASAQLPTPWGVFTMTGFKEEATGKDHVALSMGDITSDAPVLARIHSECLTGDALFSLRCDCGFQLQAALQRIAEEKRGVLLYVRQEGRGIGLMNKIKAYKLQEEGMDTVDANLHLGFDADERDYGVGAQILREVGVCKIRLMTNNPVKRIGLEAYGLSIIENVPLEVTTNPHNAFYMQTKKTKMGHNLKHIK